MQPASAFAITPAIRKEIVRIIDDRIKEAHVTKEGFSELKAIVRDIGVKVGDLAVAQKELAEAQKRTEVKVEELAEAQKRTEVKVVELAEAQKRTEIEVRNLTEAQKELTHDVRLGLQDNRRQTGGLAKGVAYAFENEACRFLPKLLEEKYGLTIKEKMVRTEIGGEEINLFCRAQRNGKEVLIVGESKLRLEDRQTQEEALAQSDLKIAAVTSEHSGAEIVPMLMTHFARPGFLQKTRERGIIVVQSFEW